MFQIIYPLYIYVIMSFPRVVPIAKRKVDYRIRNLFTRGTVVYAVGFFGVGEYFGWWDGYNINRHDENDPADIVARVQTEDEQTWFHWSGQLLNSKASDLHKAAQEKFARHMPIGLQNIIKDDEELVKMFRGESSVSKDDDDKISIQTRGPFFTPEYVSKKDLVTFTSSKSSRDKDVTVETPP